MPWTTRRRLMIALGSSVVAAPFIACAARRGGPFFAADPFTLGVASGDPDATSVVLWTRLAPDPLQADGGLPPRAVPVDWEIAADESMRQIVGRGTVEARPEEAHSLRVVVEGLMPDRPYWYRFATRDAQSRTGRTRTLPAPDAAPDQFALAVAGCQNIEEGYYGAWADIAEADLGAIFHYGDYIYEYPLDRARIARRFGRDLPDAILPGLSTLDQYRLRYALYKLDPDLAAAHAAHPFLQSFDDHEVTNNWGGDYAGSEEMSQADYFRLRAAALQAFYEHAPVRPAMRPRGPNIKAYRDFAIGNLLRIAVMDTRQNRSLPVCGHAGTQHCPGRRAPGRSLIGADQEAWLIDLFGRGGTPWTLLANQMMMMQNLIKDAAADIVDTDTWDGTPDGRRRLLEAAADRKVSGLITVAGDIHRAIAGDLKADYDRADAPVVGTELVGTSISSSGDGGPDAAHGASMRALNPHIKFFDGRRGYLVCRFDKDRCQADFRALDYISKRGAPARTIASFTLEAGKPGLA